MFKFLYTIVSTTLSLVLITGCSSYGLPAINQAALEADTIFLGDHILTMDDQTEGATAVAIHGNTIVAVGNKQQILNFKGNNTRVIELGDQLLTPGFIDTHGHLAATARFIDFVNLSAPPVGNVKNFDDLINTLQHRLETDPPEENEWLIGFGYDDSLLSEANHPTRDELDKVSKEIPIVIVHVSGHLGVINSAAIKLSGLNARTPDPAGGVFRRYENSNEPNGVLEETAMFEILYARLGEINADKFKAMLAQTMDYYASHGITTIQDGAVRPNDINLFTSIAADQTLPIDVAAYRYFSPDQTDLITTFEHQPDYLNGYRVAGVKFSTDGSPQGRTAWLTKPYHELPEGADESYVAYPTVEANKFIDAATHLIRNNTPIIVHTNGDAAIDLLNEAVTNALSDDIKRDHRTVAIHAQLMRSDQVELAAQLEIVPSFFSAHTFFWGDWHLKSFGQQRGENISPTRWAIDRGVRFTVHNDAPVVPPDMLRLLWATVNRETRSGRVIGAAQRLSPKEALAAITRDAAYQYFEEDHKGTISVGKQADLVILSEDITLIEPDRIKDIKIVETFSRGTSIFRQRKQ